MRLTVKATCPMDLTYFPMDSQLCTLEIESYGYTMDDVVYQWNSGISSVQVDPEVGPVLIVEECKNAINKVFLLVFLVLLLFYSLMIVVYFILKDIEQMYKKSIILTQY